MYAHVHTLIMPRLLRKHVVGQNLLFGFRVGFCLQRDQSLRLQKQTEMEGGINVELFSKETVGLCRVDVSRYLIVRKPQSCQVLQLSEGKR